VLLEALSKFKTPKASSEIEAVSLLLVVLHTSIVYKYIHTRVIHPYMRTYAYKSQGKVTLSLCVVS
jgi:hypothetical protein